MSEQKAVEYISSMLKEIIYEDVDTEEARKEKYEDILSEELSLTKKQKKVADKLLEGELPSFEAAMVILEKLIECDYWLSPDEVEHFNSFIHDKKYNKKFRHTKRFLKAREKFD